jgi:hypothetical protein
MRSSSVGNSSSGVHITVRLVGIVVNETSRRRRRRRRRNRRREMSVIIIIFT